MFIEAVFIVGKTWKQPKHKASWDLGLELGHHHFCHVGQRQSQDEPKFKSGEIKSPLEELNHHFAKGLDMRRGSELGPFLQSITHS